MVSDTTKATEITVRHATLKDAAALINLKKGYINETTSIPLYVYEYTNTISQEQEWIDRFIMQDNSALFVAEYNGVLIGNLDLTGSPRQKLAHTAMLGMGVAWNWQNKKVGTLLMEAAMEWAIKNRLLNIIWLEVYATNNGGLKLYKNFGFEECGIMRNFFKEDIPVDKITMVKYL
jgi:ribosomal protein S18 acetylase RimI-like enzyme